MSLSAPAFRPHLSARNSPRLLQEPPPLVAAQPEENLPRNSRDAAAGSIVISERRGRDAAIVVSDAAGEVALLPEHLFDAPASSDRRRSLRRTGLASARPVSEAGSSVAQTPESDGHPSHKSRWEQAQQQLQRKALSGGSRPRRFTVNSVELPVLPFPPVSAFSAVLPRYRHLAPLRRPAASLSSSLSSSTAAGGLSTLASSSSLYARIENLHLQIHAVGSPASHAGASTSKPTRALTRDAGEMRRLCEQVECLLQGISSPAVEQPEKSSYPDTSSSLRRTHVGTSGQLGAGADPAEPTTSLNDAHVNQEDQRQRHLRDPSSGQSSPTPLPPAGQPKSTKQALPASIDLDAPSPPRTPMPAAATADSTLRRRKRHTSGGAERSAHKLTKILAPELDRAECQSPRNFTVASSDNLPALSPEVGRGCSPRSPSPVDEVFDGQKNAARPAAFVASAAIVASASVAASPSLALFGAASTKPALVAEPQPPARIKSMTSARPRVPMALRQGQEAKGHDTGNAGDAPLQPAGSWQFSMEPSYAPERREMEMGKRSAFDQRDAGNTRPTVGHHQRAAAELNESDDELPPVLDTPTLDPGAEDLGSANKLGAHNEVAGAVSASSATRERQPAAAAAVAAEDVMLVGTESEEEVDDGDGITTQTAGPPAPGPAKVSKSAAMQDSVEDTESSASDGERPLRRPLSMRRRLQSSAQKGKRTSLARPLTLSSSPTHERKAATAAGTTASGGRAEQTPAVRQQPLVTSSSNHQQTTVDNANCRVPSTALLEASSSESEAEDEPSRRVANEPAQASLPLSQIFDQPAISLHATSLNHGANPKSSDHHGQVRENEG